MLGCLLVVLQFWIQNACTVVIPSSVLTLGYMATASVVKSLALGGKVAIIFSLFIIWLDFRSEVRIKCLVLLDVVVHLYGGWP